MSNNDRLISLEERMDQQLHAFGYTTKEEERSNTRRTATLAGGSLAIGAASGAGVMGAKKLREGVINKGGVVDDYGNMVARKGMYQKAGKQTLDEAKAGAKKVARAGIEKTAGGVDAVGEQMRKKAWLAGPGAKGRGVQALKKGEQLAGGLSKKIRSASKYLSAGEVQAIAHLAERIAVLELESEDDLHDFAMPADYYSRYPVVSQEHRGDLYKKRAGAVAAAGAAVGVGYGARKVRDKVVSGYGSAMQSSGKMVPRQGMYADAGKDAYGVVKKKVGVYADAGVDAMKKAKGNVLARFAKTAAKVS